MSKENDSKRWIENNGFLKIFSLSSQEYLIIRLSLIRKVSCRNYTELSENARLSG